MRWSLATVASLTLMLVVRCSGDRRRGWPSEVSPLAPPPTELSAASRTAEASSKDPRLLSVLQVVRFPNAECISTQPGLNGTCYLASECTAAGGVASGPCAKGFGVCCLFSVSCGQTTSRNGTVFTGPGDLAAPFNCRLSVGKMNENICQLRLDLDRLSLASPNSSGVCLEDRLIISGSSSASVPAICGENSGQHLYVDVAPGASGQVMLQVITSGNRNGTSQVRDWQIRVSQIECNSPARAPPSCLQYYTNVTGMIKSFGFDGGVDASHLANQRYAICIRTAAGFCGIQYTACPVPGNFSVSESIGPVKGENSCTDDYLTIAGVSTNGVEGPFFDRHCGTQWSGDNTGPGPGTTFSRPFVVYVRFDGTETSIEQQDSNRGFCLDYTQLPCTSSRTRAGPEVSSGPLLQQQQVSSGLLTVLDPYEQPDRALDAQQRQKTLTDTGALQRGWNTRNNYYYG